MTMRAFQSAVGSPLGCVTAAGWNHNTPLAQPGPMRVYGSYALVYSLAGLARYEDTRGHTTDIHPGDLIIVFPDVGHRYGPTNGQTWDEYFVCFEGPVFDLWRKQGVLTPVRPVYHLTPLEYWLNRFEAIVAPNLPALERVCRVQAVLADALTNYQRDVAAERDEAWLVQRRDSGDEHRDPALRRDRRTQTRTLLRDLSQEIRPPRRYLTLPVSNDGRH